MSTAILRLQYRAIQQKVNLLALSNINWKLIYILAFAACMAMLVFYIFGVNKLTEGTYLVKNYNREIKSLMVQNRNLEVLATKTSFLGLTQDKARELNFEKITNVTYLSLPHHSLAKAK